MTPAIPNQKVIEKKKGNDTSWKKYRVSYRPLQGVSPTKRKQAERTIYKIIAGKS